MIDVSISVPSGAIHSVVEETRSYGLRGVETGGFLMASTGSDAISGVALAGDLGILRRQNLFQISEVALDRLFTFANDHGLWIPVQFHSHRFGQFMSKTDALHGLRVDGFISVILPRFANPPVDVGSWGWWQFQDCSWAPSSPARIGGGWNPGMVVVFDEAGVVER